MSSAVADMRLKTTITMVIECKGERRIEERDRKKKEEKKNEERKEGRKK